MVLELATVLLGACVGAVAVLYAAPKGYLGHPRKKGSSAEVAPMETYTTATEQDNAPTAVVPIAVVPAPSQSPAMYETVQPKPAPVTYSAPSTTSFGSPSMTKKPTRTYRRRAAPSRSTAGSKATRNTKSKKR